MPTAGGWYIQLAMHEPAHLNKVSDREKSNLICEGPAVSSRKCGSSIHPRAILKKHTTQLRDTNYSVASRGCYRKGVKYTYKGAI